MNKKLILTALSMAVSGVILAQNVEVEAGEYAPDWQNLSKWECPEWFKDAKFGIWAHWGPQCEAEGGDWYARGMYYKGSGQYNWHVKRYGDPAVFGFKDVINAWEAENWNPEELIDLYYAAGARYFFTLGQHHDNFDLWDSPYQQWNAVNMGPKRDIVKGWADACKKHSLPIGISMHGSHTWTWMEISQDFDGNLTAADGVGKWWEGYDPQELYAQRHDPSAGYRSSGTIHSQWDWGNGASLPSEEYKLKFQNRVLQCINDYDPDMIYFDDTVLPFYGCDDAVGLNILSHYYNHDANDGGDGVVVMGKQLLPLHKEAMLWDIERGIPDRPQADYWQTCTCIGSWHYDAANTNYKSAQQVVCMLIDVVSKNGNLLLSIPIRGDGTIDSKERAVVAGITDWMRDNGKSLYGTRPWTNFGEGPLAEAVIPLSAQGFNESNNYSARDVRFVQRNDTVYATIMRWPELGSQFVFQSFGLASPYYNGNVAKVTLLGHGDVDFALDFEGLRVSIPDAKCNDIAPVFEITFDGSGDDVPLEQYLPFFKDKLEYFLSQSSDICTGKYRKDKVEAFAAAIDEAEQCEPDDEAQCVAALKSAYQDIKKNGIIGGGLLDYDGIDVTADRIGEARNFSRTDDTNNGKRFGKPKYWTVENFKIPNGNDGVKQGLDKFNGNDALMLGVWDDQAKNQEGSLANARVYKKVSLQPGAYYFGAMYNALYNLSDAYVFVSDAIVDTQVLPEASIACFHINQSDKNDMKFYGLYFSIDAPKDVYIGFQADLTGVAQQEFRADEVKLAMLDQAELAAEDLTVEKLVEKSAFSRTDETNTGKRFGAPKYWTVENFSIPNGSDGVKQGIDKYPGYDCLMLGVWDDAARNEVGDLHQARIYRTVQLEPGAYRFGAVFQTNYNITSRAYMFAAPGVLATDELPASAMAFARVKDAAEGAWQGINFVVAQPMEVVLGFQADLTEKAQQEFRVKEVRLQKFAESSVSAPAVDVEIDAPEYFYDLNGRRLRSEPEKGFYIRLKGAKSAKILK